MPIDPNTIFSASSANNSGVQLPPPSDRPHYKTSLTVDPPAAAKFTVGNAQSAVRTLNCLQLPGQFIFDVGQAPNNDGVVFAHVTGEQAVKLTAYTDRQKDLGSDMPFTVIKDKGAFHLVLQNPERLIPELNHEGILPHGELSFVGHIVETLRDVAGTSPQQLQIDTERDNKLKVGGPSADLGVSKNTPRNSARPIAPS